MIARMGILRPTGIGKDLTQPGKGAADGGQQLGGAVAILHVGRVHEGGDEMAQRVRQQVPFAPLDL